MSCKLNKKFIITITLISLVLFLSYMLYSVIVHKVNLFILISLAVWFAINYILFTFCVL